MSAKPEMSSTGEMYGAKLPMSINAIDKKIGMLPGKVLASGMDALDGIFNASPMARDLTKDLTEKVDQTVQIGSEGLGSINIGKSDAPGSEKEFAGIGHQLGGEKTNNTGAVFGRGGK